MSDLLVRKSAVISPCGTYRYRLTREWGAEPPLPFVMLNPSTADAEVDDPTIRRCMGFARRERAGGVVVANLFALRATSPADLRKADHPFGPDNEAALIQIARDAAVARRPIVCAWGAHGAIEGFGRWAIELFKSYDNVRLACLGITATGHPRHPLYVKGDQPLAPFPRSDPSPERER